eukprot:3590622-Alexandrium_andersonii.AAC.1
MIFGGPRCSHPNGRPTPPALKAAAPTASEPRRSLCACEVAPGRPHQQGAFHAVLERRRYW